jgi:DNA-binding HxlR family transcriptional regulator
MSDEVELLKTISQKLSQLIFLTKLSNSELIEQVKKEIRKDKVAKAILDLADGVLITSQLKSKVAGHTKVSEKTVERRISDLVEKGAGTRIRKGNEVYYENSGLYD